MYSLDNTIAAIASAPGGAARGIVRLSGPNILDFVKFVFRPNEGSEIPSPYKPIAIRGVLNLLGINSALPCDVFLWPNGRSYTGQMVAEFHTLGSPPLLDELLNSLCTAGARLAEPGEFTLRAFLYGRIDLTQAEAVLGVIDAVDKHELNVALTQLAGGLAGPMHRLRDTLLELLAHIEAGFDFADEELPFITTEELQRQLGEAVELIDGLSEQMESRTAGQSGVGAVLLGRPNTGKSSLFNALTKRQHALVSDLPGTTRDYLTAELDFDGRKCLLIDTAGYHTELFNSSPEITNPDVTAQTATAQQIDQAHVRLLCLDATRPLDDWEQAQLSSNEIKNQIVVWTKCDISSDLCRSFENSAGLHRPLAGGILTSSVSGEGIDQLLVQLRRIVYDLEATTGDVMASTAMRCRESLHHAGESLKAARDIAVAGAGEEFIAAEIRLALDEIGKIVGAIYTDDVLEKIFSRFCVGK